MVYLFTQTAYSVVVFFFLSQGYMRPLKQPDGGSIVDPLLVDEMFYQIPEILEHHEHFLEQVDGCVNQWHDRKTVGHLLIQSVSTAGDKKCQFAPANRRPHRGDKQSGFLVWIF